MAATTVTGSITAKNPNLLPSVHRYQATVYKHNYCDTKSMLQYWEASEG